MVTKVNGTALAPITIEGTDTGLNLDWREQTTVAGISRVFRINNSYYPTALPSTLAAVKSFKDSIQSRVADSSLISLGAADAARGIAGVVIADLALEHAGGDCVRIANRAHNNIVERSTMRGVACWPIRSQPSAPTARTR